MSHRLASWHDLGILLFQDHDKTVPVGNRRLLAACRGVEHSDSLDDPEIDPKDTYGHVLGGLLVRVRDGARDDVHGWWLTGCGVINDDAAAAGPEPDDGSLGAEGRERLRLGFGGTVVTVGDGGSNGWVPAFGPGTTDNRFGGVRPRAHPVLARHAWPRGWTALVSAGTDEDNQREILHPDFLGLVAPHRAGAEEAGTPVFDLDPTGKLDKRRFARLQESMRVALVPPRVETCMPGTSGREIGLLAWQLGFARDGIKTSGLVADEGSAPVSIAAPRAAGGPLDPENLPPGFVNTGAYIVGPNPSGPGYVRYDEVTGEPIGGVVYLTPPGSSAPSGDTQVGGVTTFGGRPETGQESGPRQGTGVDAPEQVNETPETPDPADQPGQVLAMLSVRHGGPIDVGAPGDVHQVGSTLDGEPIVQAHLATSSIFRGPGWDCGLQFDLDPYEDTQDGQVWVETVLRVDPGTSHATACGEYPGLGRWQTKVPMYSHTPETPPSTPRIPGPVEGVPANPVGGGGRDKRIGRPTSTGREPRGNTGFGQADLNSSKKLGRGGLTRSGVTVLPGGVTVAEPGGFLGNQYATAMPAFFALEATDEMGFSASLAPVVAPSYAFRPQLRSTGAPDLRRAADVPASLVRAFDQEAPIVAQALSFAKESGGLYSYGRLPMTGRWIGGDADGGVLIAPPDVDESSPSATSSRATYFALRKDVVGGVGLPSSDGSSLVGGWRVTYDDTIPAFGDYVFTPVDANGDHNSSAALRTQSDFRVQDASGATRFLVEPNVSKVTLSNKLLGGLDGDLTIETQFDESAPPNSRARNLNLIAANAQAGSNEPGGALNIDAGTGDGGSADGVVSLAREVLEIRGSGVVSPGISGVTAMRFRKQASGVLELSQNAGPYRPVLAGTAAEVPTSGSPFANVQDNLDWLTARAVAAGDAGGPAALIAAAATLG